MFRLLPLIVPCALLAAALAAPVAAQNSPTDEYQLLGYTSKAEKNRIATLASKLESGEVTLEFSGHRGYLDSFLHALGIDPNSQVLVFSKTSLQHPLIDAKHPRAVYFNDDTYIGWVQNSNLVEVMTTDARLGNVFYAFHNLPNAKEPIERQSQRCLVCHDSSGAGGGGVPQILAQSSVYGTNDMMLAEVVNNTNVTDKTPIDKRWGGWYVTGLSGKQKHLGNVQLDSEQELARLERNLEINIPTLADQMRFDPRPYAGKTSDIVALLVLEHQLTVQNQLTYIRFKAPAVLERSNLASASSARSWDELPEKARKVLTRMNDELVRLMFFTDAAPFTDAIKGNADYVANFEAAGPKDQSGRSLRQFDLQKRLFKYPLSYLVYSEFFDTLPPFSKDYVMQQIAAVLQGKRKDIAANLTAAQRKDISEILLATKPEFAGYFSR